MKDRSDLIEAYNATAVDDGTGEIETYEFWLERQLISRINTITQMWKTIGDFCKSINDAR